MKSNLAQRLCPILERRVEHRGDFGNAAKIINGLQTGNDHFTREAYENIIGALVDEISRLEKIIETAGAV